MGRPESTLMSLIPLALRLRNDKFVKADSTLISLSSIGLESRERKDKSGKFDSALISLIWFEKRSSYIK